MEDRLSVEAEWSRCVLGYNNMALNGKDEFLCPLEPSDQHQPEPESPAPCATPSVPSFTTEGALEALRKYVSEQGLDPRPANEATVTDLLTIHCYRYRLETFTETRFTRWNTDPYTGEDVEEVSAPAPPWDMFVEEPPLFNASSRDIALTNTKLVKVCGRCDGRGSCSCSFCFDGKEKCDHCIGRGYNNTYNYYTGYLQHQLCCFCSGQGHVRCSFCSGKGQTKCNVCLEHKKTTLSISLRVKWMNHQDQVLCGSSEPQHLQQLQQPQHLQHLQQLPGQRIMNHTAPRVGAISDFLDPAVIRASQTLVLEHAEKYKLNARILQQRQTVELVSLCRVLYAWRGRSYTFYISAEDGAFVDDYPESSCLCCSVM
ncbi:protein SSUH2 homolog [Eucyclogobius newberryi]|uniref:protein SSUH2 homolog n=1 Tax=Eucyclogobius newberryi TaxID=166745 RepID=UPI003B5C4D5D